MAKHNIKIKTLKELGSLNPRPGDVKASWFQNSAFFDPQDFLQVKYEMLRSVSIEGKAKSKAAELFGVSRPTFYETETAFLRDGLVGLLPQKRGPREAHKLSANVMKFIQEHTDKDQNLGAKELAKLIKIKFNISVHPRSIERAFARKKKFHNKNN